MACCQRYMTLEFTAKGGVLASRKHWWLFSFDGSDFVSWSPATSYSDQSFTLAFHEFTTRTLETYLRHTTQHPDFGSLYATETQVFITFAKPDSTTCQLCCGLLGLDTQLSGGSYTWQRRTHALQQPSGKTTGLGHFNRLSRFHSL